MIDVSPLLENNKIGHLEVRNRMVVAPMSRVSTPGDGVPTENMREYYREFADGGFGLVVAEGTFTDDKNAQAYPGQPGIVTDAQVEGWSRIVDSVHDGGSSMVLQLMHAGPLVQLDGHQDRCIGPSAVRPVGKMLRGYGGNQGDYMVPREMSMDDIEYIRDSFVECARRAAQAGFDGVEVHAANGYLFDQFITRYGNQRTDQYGGSPENRARLTAEVIAAIREDRGDGFVVGVRVSQAKVNDFDYRWQGVDEATRLLATVADGGPHYVHVASEGVSWRNSAFLDEGMSVTSLAREVCKVPVIANGALGEPAEAARLIHEGHADLISLGESALANPDWPHRVASGKPLDSFDIAMLKPEVTIENALAWRGSRG